MTSCVQSPLFADPAVIAAEHGHGYAVTESPVASLSHEAFELIESIAAALERALKKDRALERDAKGPARLVRSHDKGREDR